MGSPGATMTPIAIGSVSADNATGRWVDGQVQDGRTTGPGWPNTGIRHLGTVHASGILLLTLAVVAAPTRHGTVLVQRRVVPVAAAVGGMLVPRNRDRDLRGDRPVRRPCSGPEDPFKFQGTRW